MIIKKVGLVVSLALMVGLQGCGGGGSDSSDTSSNASVSKSTDKTLDKSLGKLSESETVDTKKVEKTVYILKEKLEVLDEYNTTTTYNYQGDFVATAKSTSTNGTSVEKSYAYDANSHILNVYEKNVLGEMELSQRAIFEKGESKKPVDLARNDNQVYLYNTFDPITYHDKVRVVKNITDIDLGLYNTNMYAYSGAYMTTLTSGYQESLEGNFTSEASYAYTYDDGLKIDGVAVNKNHTFMYSDDNKTVTEMADGKVLRRYVFEVEGE